MKKWAIFNEPIVKVTLRLVFRNLLATAMMTFDLFRFSRLTWLLIVIPEFIYVKDIVRALLFFAEDPDIRGEVFNLGYGKRITVQELAEKIRALIHKGIDIQFKEEREGDIRHSQAGINKLTATGFTFKYDFDTGLKRLAESFS